MASWGFPYVFPLRFPATGGRNAGFFAAIAGVTNNGMRAPSSVVAAVLILIGVFAFFAVLPRLV
jgi:hypothetical protein